MVLIADGATGTTAKVDEENRLTTRAFGVTDLEHAAEEGQAFY